MQVIVSMLRQLHVGAIEVSLPDGRHRVFGDRTAALRATIEVHDWRVFTRLLRGASVGVGESSMEGEWSSSDLVSLIRIMIANRRVLRWGTPGAVLSIAGGKLIHAWRANRLGRAKRNTSAHYDLSKELYRLFLDDTMTYSAAYFEDASASLEDAQEATYRRLAEKIRVDGDSHVLEIGCGWGGSASFAARTYGCRVTGITLSEQQAACAWDRMRREGLDHLADIEVVDYRKVRGSFDRIVSIEMLEAVRHRYLGTDFAAVDRLPAPDGLAAIQVITIPEQRYDNYRLRPDFIQRYIFPGGHLPSLEASAGTMGRSSELYIDEVENVGMHVAENLHRWGTRFLANAEEVRALGFDERFVRMWEFYLAYCEGAFLARYINDLQLVLTRPMSATLATQAYGQRFAPVSEADLPERRLTVVDREGAAASHHGRGRGGSVGQEAPTDRLAQGGPGRGGDGRAERTAVRGADGAVRAQARPAAEVLLRISCADAPMAWWRRWRTFTIACQELFAARGGDEWYVSHHRFVRPAR